MSAGKVILMGGAAAVIMAAAGALFPPMKETRSISRLDGDGFAQAEAAFSDMLTGSPQGLAGLEAFGLVAARVDGVDDTVLLSEGSEDCSGQGIYWIRRDAAHPLAITAPHRGSDRHTGKLAAALFAETNAQAAAWNSAPRYADGTCENGIDLAREKDHLFSAFTLGFARAAPDGLVVQLHGFDGARRDKLAAEESAMILSNGSDRPSGRLLDLADRLSLAFAPREVLVYPIGTRELGATGNAQGRLLREAGFESFVHIEISADLRSDLLEDAELRGKLADALTGVGA